MRPTTQPGFSIMAGSAVTTERGAPVAAISFPNGCTFHNNVAVAWDCPPFDEESRLPIVSGEAFHIHEGDHPPSGQRVFVRCVFVFHCAETTHWHLSYPSNYYDCTFIRFAPRSVYERLGDIKP